jgi:hypothetical protein
VEEGWVYVESGEADTGDAQRIAFAQTACETGSFNGEPADATGILEADERAGLLPGGGSEYPPTLQ